MALSVKNLSPMALKGLKSGNKITIRYALSQQEVDDHASRIIYEGFPKNVATAFSSKWAALFPAINKLTVVQLSLQPLCKAVTIVGGSTENASAILEWMLSCCDGNGFQEFPFPTEKPFSKYYKIKESADIMGATVLSNEMTARMNSIAARQVHSEDVRAMYQLLPADDPLLKEITTRIAELIRVRRLKAFGAYEAVRRDVPAFDKAIEAILGPRKTKEQKTRETVAWKARKEAQAKNVRKQTNRRQPLVPRVKPYQHKTAHMEPITQHKTIHCPITRKAVGGRPAYVALPLAEIGVNKHDFTGTRLPVHGNGSVRDAKGLGADTKAVKGANTVGASVSAPDLLE